MPNKNQNTNRTQENNKEERLKKAELFSIDGKKYDFEFMFNPTEITIKKTMNVTENRGAREGDHGIPKVSFAHPNATVITISNIMFDVYENKQKDLDKKIEKLTQTVKFVEGKNRPPIYLFMWGKVNYLKCYVESVDYQLTLFLPDGTPVRAKASITLKEIDPSMGSSNPPANATPEERERSSRWQSSQTGPW